MASKQENLDPMALFPGKLGYDNILEAHTGRPRHGERGFLHHGPHAMSGENRYFSVMAAGWFGEKSG
jgi:hypothetical protein